MNGHETCAQCGFDGAKYGDGELLQALRGLGPSWRAQLAEAGPELRARPEATVWSAVEYAAHSRDITALHVYGVEQALTLDEPSMPAIADDLVDSVADTYASADPGEVLDDLERQSSLLAQIADDAGPGTWGRGLTIGDERIEVRRMLEHALHDSVHHLDDVERGLEQLRA